MIRKNLFNSAVLVSSLLASFTQHAVAAGKKAVAKKDPAAVTAKVDPSTSSIKWEAKKVTGQHNGQVKIKEGNLTLMKNALTGGEVTIDMSSISVTDITDTKMNEKLVGHLKSDDFFGVEKHPTATFKITKVEAIAGAVAGKPNYTVTGDLTIKKTTKPTTIPALITVKDKTVKAVGSLEIDRTLYDVRYGSGKFFEKLGDKAISDNFKMDLDLSSKL